MSQNASPKERAITLCLGMFYMWLGMGPGHDMTAGASAMIYTMFTCWLIWYPDQVSQIQLGRRFRTPFRIPPLYIRYVGWVMLLAPLAILVSYTLAQPFFQTQAGVLK